MLTRVGSEITVECQKPTPMLLALKLHPSNDNRIIGTDPL
jgi:hypothetical protein